MSAIVLLFLLVYLVGWVMVVAAAFRQSTVWGLIVLFIPFAFLAFAVVNWGEARRGVLIMLGAFGIAIVGSAIFVPIAHKNALEKARAEEAPKTDSAAMIVNTPSTPEPAYIPPPPPKPAPVAAEPEPEQPVIKKVYVDNASHKYFPEDCKNLPPNAYKMARTLAVGQGYKEAACP